MIDTHCHILWGVDDASIRREQSLDMLHLAISDGVEAIVATSHLKDGMFDNDFNSLSKAFNLLQKAIEEENLGIKIYMGAENFVAQHTIHKLDKNEFIPYNNGKYMLVEFAWTNNIHDHPTRYLEKIIDKGYCPVIAHPERYECVHDDLSILSKWKEMGCLLQVNRTSILQLDKISFANEIALWMLEHDLVDVIASDAHRSYAPRYPKLSDVYQYVSAHYGEEVSKRCLCDNPKKILGI